ncbi:MAG: tripartite tricarboxylate transporter substrate-binding protein, partial [Aquincola tertiaricarbonis]
AGVGSIPDFIENHKAGKLRVVAVMGKERQAILPDMPTFAELGVAGFEDVPYYGIFAPAGTPRRAQLGWDVLAAWPAWAGWPADRRDRLLSAAGAWYLAPVLRQCIDGRVLQALAGMLGQAEADRLLQSDGGGEPDGPWPDLSPAMLADRLAHTGREVLLAAVASPALRLVLREAFWPDTRAPLPALDTAAAAAALQAAARAEARP